MTQGSGLSSKISFRSFKINRKDTNGSSLGCSSQVSILQNLRIRKKTVEEDEEDDAPVREELLSIGAGGDMEVRGGPVAAQHLIIPCRHPIPPLKHSDDTQAVALDLDSGSGLKFRIKRCPSSSSPDVSDVKKEAASSEDELAAEALRRDAYGDTSSPSFIISGPILARNRELACIRAEGLSEKEVLRRELERLPDVTYESYEAVPIDQFGLAMLYGMGYDPSIHTTQACELKKRIYQRAGLGADKEFELGVKSGEV